MIEKLRMLYGGTANIVKLNNIYIMRSGRTVEIYLGDRRIKVDNVNMDYTFGNLFRVSNKEKDSIVINTKNMRVVNNIKNPYMYNNIMLGFIGNKLVVFSQELDILKEMDSSKYEDKIYDISEQNENVSFTLRTKGNNTRVRYSIKYNKFSL